MVLFSSLEYIFYHNQNKIQFFLFFAFLQVPIGVCGIFRPLYREGGSNELILNSLSPMILYNHPLFFKSGEINSCRLSPLPTIRANKCQIGKSRFLTCSCRKIYRVEVVGLSISNYTFKITVFFFFFFEYVEFGATSWKIGILSATA